MANSLVDDGVGALPEPTIIVASKDGTIGLDSIVQINNTLSAIFKRFNGRISWGGANQAAKTGNIDGQWITLTKTPSVADTEFTVPHGLKRTPVFVFSLIDKAGSVYASQYASWNSSNIYLKCSASSAAAVLALV